MRIFYSDGRQREMCGNGARCFARLIAELENLQGKWRLAPNKGLSVVKSDLEVDGVTPKVTRVSMGNPHRVTFGTKDDQNMEVDKLKLAEIGPKFEHHEMFPARTDTEFVQVSSRSHLKTRVWEHGAGATMSCVKGDCATVVAAVLEGLAGRIVDFPRGTAREMEWREKDDHAYMIRPAEVPFFGSLPL